MYISLRVSKTCFPTCQEKLSESYLVRGSQCFNGHRMLFIGGAVILVKQGA